MDFKEFVNKLEQNLKEALFRRNQATDIHDCSYRKTCDIDNLCFRYEKE